MKFISIILNIVKELVTVLTILPEINLSPCMIAFTELSLQYFVNLKCCDWMKILLKLRKHPDQTTKYEKSNM